MKTNYAIFGGILMLGLSSVAPSIKAETFQIDTRIVDLTIDVKREPVFPISLQQQGYSDGKVVIAFEVDYSGELRDWIVLEATHPAFVDALANVIDTWDFSPPKINGESRSIVSRLIVNYHTSGNVLSFDLVSGLATRFNELTGWQSQRIALAEVADLDSPPTPTRVIKPSVPKDVLQKYSGSKAVFTFYVDENGRVRIPVLHRIDGEADPGMLLAAQEALEQWRFEPPTVNSHPVSIQLSQQFVFADR